MAEQTAWSVASDNPNQDYQTNYITPVSVTRGEAPIRSRSNQNSSSSSRSSGGRSQSRSHQSIPSLRMAHHSANTSRLDNDLSKSLSRVAIANVLNSSTSEQAAGDHHGPKSACILSTEALLHQKEQMQRNNEELNKYMKYKKDLEEKIRQLERENNRLRRQRTTGVAPEPNYQPQSHKKQKIINELHEAIYKSQKDYDEKVEQINEVNFKTQALQNDIKVKLEKANHLQKERENQQRKANSNKLQVPPKEDEKDRLERQIAKNELEFQHAYSELMKRLAEIKPVEIPEEALKPTGQLQQVHLDHVKQQMMRIRKEIQEINDNVMRNKELAQLRADKTNLEKANDAMNKQTDLLEKKIELITEESIETKRHTAAKKAEVENLKKAYDEELHDHEDKMRRLHAQYKELYDKYQTLIKDISDQKERATQHKSIKEELEEMRRLLNMERRFSMSTNTRGEV